MKLLLIIFVISLINCQLPLGLFNLMNHVQQNFNNQVQMQGKIRRMRGFSRQTTRNPDGSVTTVTREFGPDMEAQGAQNQSQNVGLFPLSGGMPFHLQNLNRDANAESFGGNLQDSQLKSLFNFGNSPIKIIKIGQISDIGQKNENSLNDDKKDDLFQDTDKIMENTFKMSNSIGNVLGHMVNDLVQDIEKEQDEEIQKEENENKKQKIIKDKQKKGVDSLLDQIDKQLLNGKDSKKENQEKFINKEKKETKKQEKSKEPNNKIDNSQSSKEQKKNTEWMVNKSNLENLNQQRKDEQQLNEQQEVKLSNQNANQQNNSENKNNQVSQENQNYGYLYGLSKLPLIFIFIIIFVSVYISLLRKKKQPHNIQNDSNFVRINKSD